MIEVEEITDGVDIEEQPEEFVTESQSEKLVSLPSNKAPQCEAMICPNASAFCRVKVKSMPPRFQQMMKIVECLSEDHKVLKTSQSVVDSNVPGEFVEKTETNPVSYSSDDLIPLGDFFVNK